MKLTTYGDRYNANRNSSVWRADKPTAQFFSHQLLEQRDFLIECGLLRIGKLRLTTQNLNRNNDDLCRQNKGGILIL